jgi:small redox-active disulfide protein 2
MAEKDITKIRIGKYDIGIIGIKHLISKIAQTDAGKSDEEVAAVMLERLGRDNYIPGSAREAYGQAFVREFRKFTGQPYEEEAPQGLEIKVLGMGCAQCDSLEQTIMGLLTELDLPASLEHVTDIKEIARYGVMGTPALVINGRIMAVGKVPPRRKLKEWLIDARHSLAPK